MTAISELQDIDDSTVEGKLLKAAIAYIILNHEIVEKPETVITKLNALALEIYDLNNSFDSGKNN